MANAKSIKFYIASPLGFADSTKCYLPILKDLVVDTGHRYVDPWADQEGDWSAILTPNRRNGTKVLGIKNRKVAARNEKRIRETEALLAVLDGVDVDSGTASEIGFAYCLGKRIVGLRTDTRRAGENEAAIVNLQVQYWIEASGGKILTSLDALRRYLSRGVPTHA
jgi:nucleoside 2-deoxyribosyltransferase